MSETNEPRWLAAANVVQARWAGETPEKLLGTKHFRPGAKVHVVGEYGGMTETVTVVGRSRQGRYITVDLDVWLLTNFRAQVVYSPVVLARAENHWENPTSPAVTDSRDAVEEKIRWYESWIDAEKGRRKAKGLHWWVAEK